MKISSQTGILYNPQLMPSDITTTTTITSPITIATIIKIGTI